MENFIDELHKLFKLGNRDSKKQQNKQNSLFVGNDCFVFCVLCFINFFWYSPLIYKIQFFITVLSTRPGSGCQPAIWRRIDLRSWQNQTIHHRQCWRQQHVIYSWKVSFPTPNTASRIPGKGLPRVVKYWNLYPVRSFAFAFFSVCATFRENLVWFP